MRTGGASAEMMVAPTSPVPSSFTNTGQKTYFTANTTTPEPTPTHLPTNRLATLQNCTPLSLCSPALPPGKHCAHIHIHGACTLGHTQTHNGCAVVPICTVGAHIHTGTQAHVDSHVGTRIHTHPPTMGPALHRQPSGELTSCLLSHGCCRGMWQEDSAPLLGSGCLYIYIKPGLLY